MLGKRNRIIVICFGIVTLSLYWCMVNKYFTLEHKPSQLLSVHEEIRRPRHKDGATSTIQRTVGNSAQKSDVIDAKYVNCAKLNSGDESEISKARFIMNLYPVKDNNDWELSQQASNCDTFLQRGYVTNATQEEQDFPIAFSVLVFKDSQQVERLLRAIYRPQNLYCVHVDKQSSLEFLDAITKLTKCFDNVFLIDQITVQWGYFSVLQPEIDCMRQLLKSGVKWRYFINLTGQEFPLKTNWELVKIFTALDGANDIPGAPGPQADFRVRYVHHGIQPTSVRKQPFPIKLQWMKGGAHIIASRAFVHYVIHNETAIKLLDYVKDSGVPDETYFQTLNLNPHLGAPGAYIGSTRRTDITRYKIWSDHHKPCSGKYVRGICIMGLGDLKRLTQANQIFVNKLYYDYQYLTMRCLEHWYHERVRNETKFGRVDLNITFYENLPQAKQKLIVEDVA